MSACRRSSPWFVNWVWAWTTNVSFSLNPKFVLLARPNAVLTIKFLPEVRKFFNQKPKSYNISEKSLKTKFFTWSCGMQFSQPYQNCSVEGPKSCFLLKIQKTLDQRPRKYIFPWMIFQNFFYQNLPKILNS